MIPDIEYFPEFIDIIILLYDLVQAIRDSPLRKVTELFGLYKIVSPFEKHELGYKRMMNVKFRG